MIEQQKNEVFLTPYKWTYEERRLYKSKGNVFFEKNYSKWATINVNHINDLVVLKDVKEGDEDCYLVEIIGESFCDSSEDTYYEHWWGDKSLKKKFKKDNEFYMEEFLERNGHGEGTEDTKITAIISKKDYVKLKELYSKNKS